MAIAASAVLLAAALLAYFAPFPRLLPALPLPVREAGETRVHFLSVGQGDCTIVESSEGDVLVVDAGDGSFRNNGKIVRYLKGLRPERLSVLVTHADRDHYGGMEAILDCFSVTRCYLPVLASDNEHYSAFLEAVEREGCEQTALTRYKFSESGTASFTCISPTAASETDENDSSAVLYLDCGGVRILLCGDITSSREKLLAEEYSLDETFFDSARVKVRLDHVDILKAAHHGSADSSSAEWLSLLSPAALILSAGAGNPYKHPSGEAMARFRAASPQGKIYRTDELGDLIVSCRGGKYTVTERN